MARYLVLAHQTARSPELAAKLKEIAAGDADAEFVLIVPATPINHRLTWEEGESNVVARRIAEATRDELQQAGLRVTRADIGDPSPVSSIDDELLARPDDYKAIVISTLPPGISRWLKLDLVHRATRRYQLTVFHVVAESAPAPATA